ncbi:MAG: lantibiotic dehydratase [Pseudonocardiaceae bacterium]
MTQPRPRSGFYQPFEQVVIRAPLLPVRSYLDLDASFDVRDLDPLVRRAISVASQTLAEALDRDPRDRKASRARRSSVLRYLIRMSTRPTPFGLFGGVAIGDWGKHTDLRVAPTARPTRTRLDTGWLIRLVLAVEQDAAIRHQLHLVANTCVFERDGRLYLSDRAACGHPEQPDVSIKATPVARRALEIARDPVSHADLVAKLVASTSGATPDRAADLIEVLCAQDLLLTDLRPPLTGDPVDHVVKRLAGVPGRCELAESLAAANDLAAKFDRDGDSPDDLPALRARIRSVGPTSIMDGDEDVLQVDSALPLLGHTVSSEVAADACRAVDALLRMHPAPGGPAHLAGYRAAFQARYGELRTVPLLELLDLRFGLGPPSAGHARKSPAGQPAAGRRAARLLDLAYTAMASGGREIQFGDADIDQLSLWSPNAQALPASLELSAFVAAASSQAIDRGEYRLVIGPNLGGQAAGRGLARFADLLGDAGSALLHRITDTERGRRGAGVVAELVYLPTKFRSANVVVRPAVREYEIPIGVSPGVPPERVIPPNELAVLVRDGRMRLWWPARDTEVTIASGHMLNSATAPTLCRFLHEIGHDGVTSLTGFDWGPAAGLPMLPRVCLGRIVLRPAQWRLSRAKAKQTLRVDDQASFGAALADWRAQWRVPRHVYLAFADNRLLIDLDDPAQAGQLRQELRRQPGNDVLLNEAMPSPDDAWLPGPGGRYLSELVISVIRRQTDSPHRTPPTPQPAHRVSVVDRSDRHRPPGSDWLYLKLYGPRATQDGLISSQLRRFADDLVAARTVDSWFFLRYTDPDPHVRLRLHGLPEVLMSRVLPQATTWSARMIGTGVLSRLGIESYDRELERYGGPAGTDIAEAIFAADSAACAALLEMRGEGAPDRLDLAALSVDDLLAGLGFHSPARLAWYSSTAPPAKVSSVAYRARGGRLRALLAGDVSVLGPWHGAVKEALATRRTALTPLAAALARLGEADPSLSPMAIFARSFTHLSCNRLGLDPATERLILGLLRRALVSLAAAPYQRA